MAFATAATLATRLVPGSILSKSSQRFLVGMSSMMARRPGNAKATSCNLMNSLLSVSNDSNCSLSTKHLTSPSRMRLHT
eukprot:CAMPEP_0177391176 /NCGR_PEP_ID=MMETSP0368-20130122/53622_1 /TAXON_ID=447022 ORGANISM="Scrippsiella hangoei-like, Strain SHHI-4" /NCGR_SAMPLE_ID=MMETSP0368 /ASSEMBLY_ACC=CAM_ASM_000363 /LENGTH=78 /DNA_ID=CAMNT_0018856963 /DNA_START=96 /DNA_END=332 /DNA_ORIENTATION=-